MLMDGARGSDLVRRIFEDLKGLNRKSGLNMHELPDSLRQLLRRIAVSRAVTCEEVAGFLCASEEEALLVVSELAAIGLLERLPICGDPRYRAGIPWDDWTRDRRQRCR